VRGLQLGAPSVGWPADEIVGQLLALDERLAGIVRVRHATRPQLGLFVEEDSSLASKTAARSAPRKTRDGPFTNLVWSWYSILAF
jgi:hypothetical protein